MARIYVASSWRNEIQPLVVEFLRSKGHEVYDFKNPPQQTAIDWKKIDPNFTTWSMKDYKKALLQPDVQAAFTSDFNAMQQADIGVLVLPSGRSANSEAGWMKGAGKGVVVFSPLVQHPDLMYLMYDELTDNLADLNRAVEVLEQNRLAQNIDPVSSIISKANPCQRVTANNSESYSTGEQGFKR